MLFPWPITLSRLGPAFPELFAVTGAKVPDLRGYFLRGLGGNSAALGVSQGDAIRNITGSMPVWSTTFYTNTQATGVINRKLIQDVGLKADGMLDGSERVETLDFNASRQVPTANENRPINKAVRYLIRARP